MMNIYTAVLTLVLLLVSPKMMAQQIFQTLVDDCYHSLELQDSISFVKTFRE